jgi:hypothetical protein
MLRVHAWLMHSVDPIEGNAKPGARFWGAIADTYNTTTEPHRQRTSKNLKDHWCTYNKQVSLFNQIYNQESSCKQSGADDAMALKVAKEQYKNRTGGSEFKRLALALVGRCEASIQVESKVWQQLILTMGLIE